MMLQVVVANGNDFPTRPAISLIVIDFAGLSRIQLVTNELKYLFNGPNTLLCKGWSLWEQCGGKDIITIPLSLARFRTSMDRWELWLSRKSATLLFLDGRTWRMKWFMNWTKSTFVIQLDLLADPAVPRGAPFIKNEPCNTKGINRNKSNSDSINSDYKWCNLSRDKIWWNGSSTRTDCYTNCYESAPLSKGYWTYLLFTSRG
jgi:hypothetical protein